MELIAETPCAAAVVPLGSLGAQVQRGLIVRLTHDVRPDGSLAPAAVSEPIRDADVVEDGMTLPRDLPMARDGVDLVLLGDAVAADAGVTAMTVDVTVGAGWRIQLAVHGERRWQRTWYGHQITAPRRFERMPLTWARAYGGSHGPPHERHTCVDNPEGRGFIPAIEDPAIDGVALPNLEWPTTPIRAWSDRPEPAGLGFYSMFWGLRLGQALDASKSPGDPARIRPRAFNTAHPRLVLERFPERLALCVRGMSANRFEVLLRAPRLVAHVHHAGESHLVRPHWDTLCVRPERAQLVITGRVWLPAQCGRRSTIVLREGEV